MQSSKQKLRKVYRNEAILYITVTEGSFGLVTHELIEWLNKRHITHPFKGGETLEITEVAHKTARVTWEVNPIYTFETWFGVAERCYQTRLMRYDQIQELERQLDIVYQRNSGEWQRA